jgi:uncharacterized protein YbjT (DUF2867 family)
MSPRTPLLIAVHGATGIQGGAVARRLLDEGHYVRAIARRPDREHGVPVGCDPFPADASDADALARAYAGMDAVYVQLPPLFDESAIVNAHRVAEALRREEVRRVVFNPGVPPPAEPVGLPYLDARFALAQALADGPFRAATVAPAGPYMENLAAPWSAPLVRDGLLAYPLPAQAPVRWVALHDLVDEVARAITGHVRGPRIIRGPSAPTGDQVAEALSAALGHQVHWEPVAPDEYGDLMRPYVGDHVAEGVSRYYAALAAGPAPPEPEPARVHTGPSHLERWARSQVWDDAAVLAPAA